jgi:adenosylhomocysteine nucleosidase
VTRNNRQGRYTVYNHAEGPVGIQAVTVNGVSASPSINTDALTIETVDDLQEALAHCRSQLDRDRAARRVDSDTYEAARAEISTAQAALDSTDAQRRRQAVLALKRLSGLAPSAAGLAAAAGRLL